MPTLARSPEEAFECNNGKIFLIKCNISPAAGSWITKLQKTFPHPSDRPTYFRPGHHHHHHYSPSPSALYLFIFNERLAPSAHSTGNAFYHIQLPLQNFLLFCPLKLHAFHQAHTHPYIYPDKLSFKTFQEEKKSSCFHYHSLTTLGPDTSWLSSNYVSIRTSLRPG